ncbi:MAG: metallophosphatase, partial [Negativicutes bacterium]|nr:metallophosphatase [Negativicutes bacterium]
MNISEGMSGQIRGWRRWARQLAVCCLALGLLLSTLPAAAAVVDFTVLSVNDFHGSLMASGKNPGIARLATFFSQQRNQNPGGVLLLAGGDMMQGSMESNLVYGASVIDAMNYVRFDGMVLGNHEFDWGIDRLRQRAAEARFPFLAANVVEKAGGQVMDFTQPYHIYDVNGVRVAVIGLTTLETVQTTHPKNVVSLDFLSPAATAGLYVPLVRQQGADVVVLLCHMGGEQTGEGGVSGEIADLALNVDGVDLIISGHSHTVLNGRLNGVPAVS